MKQLSVARHAGKELEVLPRSGVWAVHLPLHHILHLRNGANNSTSSAGPKLDHGRRHSLCKRTAAVSVGSRHAPCRAPLGVGASSPWRSLPRRSDWVKPTPALSERILSERVSVGNPEPSKLSAGKPILLSSLLLHIKWQSGFRAPWLLIRTSDIKYGEVRKKEC